MDAIGEQLNMEELPPPNVIVAKDGSGHFTTIMEAIQSYPASHQGRFIIYIKAGIYKDEYVVVGKEKVNLLLYGDCPDKTIITGSRNFKQGYSTRDTSSFATYADDFIAKSIAFENTSGAQGEQAVALLVGGDRSAVYDYAISGYQDTLYLNENRQFYRNCQISGTVDFIFGKSTCMIQKSKILLRKPSSGQQNVIVADGREEKNNHGIVLHNCEIVADLIIFPDPLSVKTYLARPWKPFSRAVFIENFLDSLIQQEGYIPWRLPSEPNTEHCYFAEFGNMGLGANVQQKAKFAKGLISKDEALQFTAEPWLLASNWLPATGIPFDASFITN